MEAVGFDERGVDRLARANGSLTFDEGLAAVRLRPDANEPLCALVRLFLARESVPVETAAAALDPVGVDELARAGLAGVRNGAVRARFALQPFEGLVIASDRSARQKQVDHVVQVGPATRMVAALTVRRPVASTLDVGTGSGVQAFLAARHSERVVGLDVNQRALRLARLNARLNDIDKVEWRHGNLFEPAENERYDLVAANPPFIVSPVHELRIPRRRTRRRCVFGGDRRRRCSAFTRRRLCDRSLQLGHRPRRRLHRHAAALARGVGCDVWVLELATHDPVAYAVQWNSMPGRRPEPAAAAAEPWLLDYRARGIGAISTGTIVIRKRDGENWTRLDHVPVAPRGHGGAHVERAFAGMDLLQELGDDRKLLTLALAPARGVARVERYIDGELERGRLTVEEGIPLSGRVPLSVAPVLAGLDGRRLLREVLEDVAAGRSAEALAGEAVPALRELVARGLLVAGRGR